MKKSKYAYFLFPLLGLAIFIPIYWSYLSTFDAKQAAHEAAVEKSKADELAESNRLRQKAVDDAVAAQKKRAVEKALKEAAEAKRVQELQEAVQARNKARAEEEQLKDKVNRLTDNVKFAQDEVDKIKADEAKQRAQEAFLEQYVAKAQANQKNLGDVLQKIQDADAAAEAARAAAAAAKKS